MADNTKLWSDDEWRAAMSSKEINDLPDSDFAYIEPGGEKDADGKTVPRSLRHYPIHDEPHVRNALARAAAEIAHGDTDAADIARKAMPAIKAAAKKFGIDVGEEKSATVPAKAIRSEYRNVPEQRVSPRSQFEFREVPNGTGGTNLKFTGFASVTGDEATYEMEDWLGPWTESISVGAFKKTLDEGADVVFLLNHMGMTLARTKPGTLKLSEVTEGAKSPIYGVTGLHSEALLDPQNMYVQAMRSAVERGDLDEMSFAFRVMRQEWNADWDRRYINEVSLDKGDVSLVNYGANDHTGGTVSLRQRFTPRGQRVTLAALSEALQEFRSGKTISAATADTLTQALGHLDAADESHTNVRGLINGLLDAPAALPNPDDDDGDEDLANHGLFIERSVVTGRMRLEALRHPTWGRDVA